jgi:hypothetical protein
MLTKYTVERRTFTFNFLTCDFAHYAATLCVFCNELVKKISASYALDIIIKIKYFYILQNMFYKAKIKEYFKYILTHHVLLYFKKLFTKNKIQIIN